MPATRCRRTWSTSGRHRALSAMIPSSGCQGVSRQPPRESPPRGSISLSPDTQVPVGRSRCSAYSEIKLTPRLSHIKARHHPTCESCWCHRERGRRGKRGAMRTISCDFHAPDDASAASLAQGFWDKALSEFGEDWKLAAVANASRSAASGAIVIEVSSAASPVEETRAADGGAMVLAPKRRSYAAEYRLKAAENRAKITAASEPEARALLLQVADTWERLAESEEEDNSPD